VFSAPLPMEPQFYFQQWFAGLLTPMFWKKSGAIGQTSSKLLSSFSVVFPSDHMVYL